MRSRSASCRRAPRRSPASETGEVDLVWNLPLESIEQFKKNPNVTVDSVPTSTWDGIIMNGAHKPFDDVRVRRAVAHGHRQEGPGRSWRLYGYGTPTHTMIPPRHPYYNKDIAIGGPDIAGAKKLLAEAGYPERLRDHHLHAERASDARARRHRRASEMLKPVGIKVDVQRVPWDKFINDIEGKEAFYVDGFYSRPTIDTSIYPWYHSNGSWNTVLWNYKNDGHGQGAGRGARRQYG